MKNVFFILFFLLLFSVSFATIPTYSDLYVNDFANVLSAEEKNELTTTLSALTTNTTAEAVVVTVNSLEGYSPIDYATKIGQTWGVGKKDTDNGLVILYAKSENKIAVAVGYGLEGILPDSKVGRILDEQYVPLRDANKISEGIVNATKEYVSEIYKNKEEVGSANLQNSDSFEWIFLGIIVAIILITIASFIFFTVKTKQVGSLISFIIGLGMIIGSFFFPEPISIIILFIGFILIMSTSGGASSMGFGGFGGGHGGGHSFGGGSFGGGSFGGGGASR